MLFPKQNEIHSPLMCHSPKLSVWLLSLYPSFFFPPLSQVQQAATCSESHSKARRLFGNYKREQNGERLASGAIFKHGKKSPLFHPPKSLASFVMPLLLNILALSSTKVNYAEKYDFHPPTPFTTSPHLSISCQTSHLDEIRYCAAACCTAYQTSLGLIAAYDSKQTKAILASYFMWGLSQH